MLAEVERTCTIDASGYCDDQILCGCDGCRYYDWKIVKLIEETNETTNKED